jgi:nitroimidazol reductase NimA-like FMN-containing flavoprotein (pyridoxamine 5'-phosphate oxidase superfamily)
MPLLVSYPGVAAAPEAPAATCNHYAWHPRGRGSPAAPGRGTSPPQYACAVAAKRSHPAASTRTRVRRLPERGVYDRSAIDGVLDAGLVAHLGFVHEEQPFVIPTLHARLGDRVYVHGSAASRTLRGLATGIPACLSVTLLDGIVLARSVFEHSMNYRSVVVLGTATTVDEPEEKRAALEAFTEKLLPGRWEEARQPTRKELKATSVLSMPLDEASAKIRDGGPTDGDSPDAELDVWAGHLPLVVTALEPAPDPSLRPGIGLPQALRPYRRPGLVG